MKTYIAEHPESALAKVYNMGTQARSPYLNYYLKLEREFGDPENCEKSLRRSITEAYKDRFMLQYNNDNDSKLGTYYRINPNLSSNVPVPQVTLEFERELVTRFRTGSHSLAMETGRYTNTPRENRLCSCGTSIQTVWHIFAECPKTRTVVEKNYGNMKEIFEDENVHNVLLAITKELKIQIW